MEVKKITRKDVLTYDPSESGFPILCICISRHFVEDGVNIIVYTNEENKTIKNEFYCTNREFAQKSWKDIEYYLGSVPEISPADIN